MNEPIPEQVFDIQHDPHPAPILPPARRIPNLGHAILFFSLSVVSILACMLAVAAILHIHTEADQLHHVGAQIAAQAAGYGLTLAISFWLFPLIWSKSFLAGIDWNVIALRRYWARLVPLAVLLAVAANVLEAHLPQPKKVKLEQYFNSTAHSWEITAFGILLGPLFEEIAFRGFLLPALATAYDWLSLERSPAGLRRWESSTDHTRNAWIFGSVFSSIAFAAIHADQLSAAWGALSVLFAVGLVISYVRVRTHSVASTVLLHAVYNASQFAAALYATGFYRHLEKLK
ncbi:MAG: CPBP family intramembrane glutamic endopeptidase [Bryocella sp.]